MLILQANPHEFIDIQCPDGQTISIKVHEAGRVSGKVRIGFDAPLEFKIHRREFLAAKARQAMSR